MHKKTRKMIKTLKLFSITAAVFLFSCNSSNKSGSENIKFDSLAHGTYSSIEGKRQVVIRNEKEYQKLWDEVYKDLDQVPRIPDVDMNKYTVIAVFMGSKPSGGYDIKINKVSTNGDKILVQVNEISPGKNCMVTDALTRPYDFVRIPKTDKAAEFKTSSVTKECQ